MPDPTQNQNNSQSPTVAPTVNMPTGQDLPPLPDFMSADNGSMSQGQSTTPVAPIDQPTDDSGSSAPSDISSVITSSPKKKFGGGKVIATILGMLLLVGGVGAGLILTQQNQIFKPQAKSFASNRCIDKAGCAAGMVAAKNSAPGAVVQNVVTGATTNIQTSSGQAVTAKNADGTAATDANGNPLYVVMDSKGQKPTGQTVDGSGNITQTKVDASGNVISTAYSPAVLKTTTDKNQIPTGYTECKSEATCNANNYYVMPDGSFIYLVTGSINSYDPNTTLSCPKGCPFDQVLNTLTTAGSNKAGAYCSGGSCPQEGDTNVAGYYIQNGLYYPIQIPLTGGGGGGGGNNPSTPTAACSAVAAYDSTWNALSATQLSALTAGTTVNFCVTGTTTGGGFDMAQFTINGTQQAQTTTQGSGAAAASFCQSYQIPASVYSFSVTAIIHDATLGWSS